MKERIFSKLSLEMKDDPISFWLSDGRQLNAPKVQAFAEEMIRRSRHAGAFPEIHREVLNQMHSPGILG